MADRLLPIPLTEKTVHLCIDMQRLFSSEGPWATPWMERVLPVVVEIASRFPERTVFTRFITPRSPEFVRPLGVITSSGKRRFVNFRFGQQLAPSSTSGSTGLNSGSSPGSSSSLRQSSRLPVVRMKALEGPVHNGLVLQAERVTRYIARRFGSGFVLDRGLYLARHRPYPTTNFYAWRLNVIISCATHLSSAGSYSAPGAIPANPQQVLTSPLGTTRN